MACGTKIICISKPLNKGTSNSCITQYAIIEIVHEFYAQSVIAVILKSFYKLNWTKLQVTVATYMKQV